MKELSLYPSSLIAYTCLGALAPFVLTTILVVYTSYLSDALTDYPEPRLIPNFINTYCIYEDSIFVKLAVAYYCLIQTMDFCHKYML